jgi:hypothetical protein
MSTRSRTRTTTLVAVAAAAALAGLAGCRVDATTPQAGASQAGASAAAPVPATPSAAQTTPDTQPSDGNAPPPTPVRGTPTGTGRTPDCRATDVRLDSMDSGSAAGSGYNTVIVGSRRTTTCHLPGYPSLVYTDQSGASHPLPTTKDAPSMTGMLLRPGARASFWIRTANGYSGYDPSSAACAHPAQYHRISVQFADGRLALTGLSLTVLCAGIDVRGWEPPPTDG